MKENYELERIVALAAYTSLGLSIVNLGIILTLSMIILHGRL